ncbi:MAG: site-specific DNA-methyltransferase, partial [Clostridiales Family XIII bacterium]|nr:site-specific DNA-methyltransferase [Clostridiales Family XIII bacterium]
GGGASGGVGSEKMTSNGRLILGDNLQVAKTLQAAILAGLQPAIDLAYLDPPFFTKAVQSGTLHLQLSENKTQNIPIMSFDDDGDFEDYLVQIAATIFSVKALLSEIGVLWLHLDYRAVHYVKILADAIFGGPEHLVNEIIWLYKSGGATKRRFARKHDTLLFYAVNPKSYKFFPRTEKSYNRNHKPYRFKGVKEYRDDLGWYTLVNMRDVWHIDMVGRTSAERTGYATQKPEELLKRILSSCTEEGDTVLDFFGGSGTTAAACVQMNRNWILCDSNPASIMTIESRILEMGTSFEVMRQLPLLDEAEIQAFLQSDDIPESRKERLRTVRFPKKQIAPVLQFDTYREEFSDGEKMRLRVSVIGYEIPGEALPVEPKNREIVAAATKAHPAQFVALLSAGFAGRAQCDEHFPDFFAPFAVSFRGEPLEFAIPTNANEEIGDILWIRAVDIFGNIIYRENV